MGYKIDKVEIVGEKGNLVVDYKENEEALRELLDKTIEDFSNELYGFVVVLNDGTRFEWEISGEGYVELIKIDDIFMRFTQNIPTKRKSKSIAFYFV